MTYAIVEAPTGGSYSIHKWGCRAIPRGAHVEQWEADSVQEALEGFFSDVPGWISETTIHGCTKVAEPPKQSSLVFGGVPTPGIILEGSPRPTNQTEGAI